jgi:hypothetical protein
MAILLMLGWCSLGASQEPSKDKPTLDMSKPVACQRIDGYEKYELLPDASLTSEDKLQVYYRPLGYKVETVEKPKPGYRFRAKFSQDGRIRKKGEKTVLMKKDKILEYEANFDDPTQRIYLINNVGLKGLAPGEYEYDLILRDEQSEGSTVTQSIAFTILPVPKLDPAPKAEGPAEPAGSASPKVPSKKTKKTSKKANPG